MPMYSFYIWFVCQRCLKFHIPLFSRITPFTARLPVASYPPPQQFMACNTIGDHNFHSGKMIVFHTWLYPISQPGIYGSTAHFCVLLLSSLWWVEAKRDHNFSFRKTAFLSRGSAQFSVTSLACTLTTIPSLCSDIPNYIFHAPFTGS